MVVAKAHHTEIRNPERLGEKVQLAAGIDEERKLSEEAMQRGLDCLKRFAQLINGLPAGAVRIVGTNALREARNRNEFIQRAEAILGHPVEVISGREEARLIYLGVSHTLADNPGKRLVADIGGGSTEFIIGQRFEPLLRESLQMGCVSFTQRYFRDGKITPARYAQAYTAARLELMSTRKRPAPPDLGRSHRLVRHHSCHRRSHQGQWPGQWRGQRRGAGVGQTQAVQAG